MENIRGLMGLNLFFNPTSLSLFEQYVLKLSNDQKLLVKTTPKTTI
jgi:hypothetical protein